MTRHDPLREALRQTGGRLTKSENDRSEQATAWRPSLLYANPQQQSARWAAACARVGRICEGAQLSRNFEAACRTATMPKLAARYLETHFYLMTRNRPHWRPGPDHNPFRGMNDADAVAKFQRLVEDICDASTGVLGSWYVK